jgi:Zn-dependent protease
MDWKTMLYYLPGIVIGLTVHEYCHALAAYLLGDSTARDQGRLTFNPLKHIDIIGFLFIVFAGFGWAKPVQFNPGNLNHPRRDKAIIAAAGPLSNLALALLFTVLIRAWFAMVQPAASPAEPVSGFLLSSPFMKIITLLIYGTMINLGLFIFNLIPIPPLDGSHIVFSGLNIMEETQRRIMKIGAPLLFIIIIVQNRTDITILPIGKLVSAIMSFLMPRWN